MDFEKIIKDHMEKYISSAEFESYVKGSVEKMLDSIVSHQFERYGTVYSEIEKQCREVMVKSLESFDFERYLPKLDYVLTEVAKASMCGQYKKTVENFKELMAGERRKEINVSELFEKYKEYCSNYADVDDDCIDEGAKWASCKMWVKKYSKSIIFECEQDEDCFKEVPFADVSLREKPTYRILPMRYDLKSLRYLSKFEIELIKLAQEGTEIIIDVEEAEDEVEVEEC